MALVAALLVPTSAGAVGDAPPETKPYKLPTMLDDGADFHARPAPLVEAPVIDAEAVFNRITACYPAVSKFKIDLNLKGMLASSDMATLEDNTSYLGKSYVGLVASMPLYSSAEVDRLRDREYRRRLDTASTVAELIGGISTRNQSTRELALYRSLEARSAVRVQSGIVEIDEQIKFMEKLAAAHEKIIVQEAKILEARLKLAGSCDPENAEKIGAWLKQIAVLPEPGKGTGK